MSGNVATHDAASGVHTITIDREDKRNALDRTTLFELEQAFAEAAARDAVRDSAVAALAEQLAGYSPLALRFGKEAVYTMAEMETNAALTYLRDASVLVSRSDDAREGITAFFEKRKPRWTGH